jgi:WD40 repeat protein
MPPPRTISATFPVRANLGGFATRGDAIALGINKLVHVSTLSSLTEKPVVLLGHTSSVTALLFLPSTGELVTASALEVVLWDLVGRAPKAVFPLPREMYVLDLVEVGARVAVVTQMWKLCLVDLVTREVGFSDAEERYGFEVTVAAWAGDRMVTSDMMENICVWNPDGSPGPVHDLGFDEAFMAEHYDRCLISLAASPCGTMLVATGADHFVRLYRLPDVELAWKVWMPKRKRRIPKKDRGVHHAAFSPTGRFIAVSLHDKTARVICVKTGDCLLALEGLETRQDGMVGFTDDGTRVISSRYQTVIMWRIFSKAERCMRALCAGLVGENDWDAQEVFKEVTQSAKRWYPLDAPQHSCVCS